MASKNGDPWEIAEGTEEVAKLRIEKYSSKVNYIFRVPSKKGDSWKEIAEAIEVAKLRICPESGKG